ncbi:hypothetical protein JCM19238_1818 [Vibrio ponticus]|nr:hypothetical protein JCM19238_1818 [Vibrio ponticus]
MINNRFVIFFKEKEVDAQKIDCMVNSAQRRVSNVMENLEADGVIK